MSVAIHDTATAAALEHVVGHASPYADGELAALRELDVVGASSLSDVARCSGLERLSLVGCDATDLDALSRLPRLRSLRVLACPITSASGLANLDLLEDLQIDFAFLEDAEPLFSLASLRRARLLGNPWSEASWLALRKYATSDSKRGPAARPIFELGSEADFDLTATRQLHKLGLQLCFASVDALRPVLVRPGKPRSSGRDFDWTDARSAEVWLDTIGDWTTDSLFDMIRTFHTQEGGNAEFDFESHRRFGDRNDALGWIETESDHTRRASLRRFIDRFPNAVFFHEDDAFQAMVERHGGVELPLEYRRARTLLAGAFPERFVEFRVDGFDRTSPRATSVLEQRVWHQPWFENYDSDEGPTIRDTVRVYPFASWRDRLGSVLAVSLDDATGVIYEYDEFNLFESLRAGSPPRTSLYPVYSSYAELLGHIVAFRFPDGTVVEAVPDHQLPGAQE